MATGYRPTVLPGIDYINPQAFSPGYENIVPRALSTGGNLMQIVEQARSAPLRRKLQELEIAEQPLRIDRLKQQLAVPEIIAGDTEVVEGPNGELVKLSSIEEIGAGGTRTPRQIRSTLKTKEQREMEAAKHTATIENLQALSNYRNSGGATQTALMKNIKAWQAAKDSGDVALAAVYENAIRKAERPTRSDQIASTWERIAELEASGDVSEAGLAKVLRASLPGTTPNAYIVAGAKAGFTPEAMEELAALPDGAAAVAQINANLLNGRKWQRELTPEQIALVNSVRAAGEPVAPVAPKAPGNSATVPAFATEAEAEAAFNAGLIQAGQRVKIGDQTGVWAE